MDRVKTADSAQEANKQLVKSERRRGKKFFLTISISVLLLLSIAGSAISLVEYQTYSPVYHKDSLLAQEAVQHLRTGVALLEALPHNPLDAQAVFQARQEFTSALTSFNRLDKDVKSLPAISMYVPVYGVKLRAAAHVLPLAIEVSQVGIIATNTLNLLIARLHNPLNSQDHGLSMADLRVIEQDFHQIKALLIQVIDRVNLLLPDDLQLDPRLGKLVATFHNNLPALQSWLAAVETLLPVAPSLLGIGTPANYLVEVLDSTELRPGGGFIGNYGIVTLSGARLTSAHITDVELLDTPFEAAGGKIPYPAAYSWFNLAPTWSFRDSNLDADFPTAARFGIQNYTREGGNVAVQGVIAITPSLIQHALDITGPIDVPEYHETVTAQNLIERIHYHQLEASDNPVTNSLPDGPSSLRKRFTALLAEHFLARVRQLPSSASGKLLQLMISSIHSKDLQIYLASQTAEKLLQSYHLDAAIQSPGEDSFLVVDANISGNKANSFILNSLDDQVTIDAKGNATHHTTLSYAWTMQGPIYGHQLYRDFGRIYVPHGAILQTQDGWQPRGSSQAFGREVWAGFFTLTFGQTRTITLNWTVPGAARKDAHGWHYQYLIQKQAGTNWTLHLRITLPSCASVTGKQGGLGPVTHQLLMLTQRLSEDVNSGVDYAC
jgi:hypothetical protein